MSAQDFIQLAFENLRGWRSHSLMASALTLNSPHGESFPYTESEPHIASHACFLLCSSLPRLEELWLPDSPLQVQVSCCQSPLKPSRPLAGAALCPHLSSSPNCLGGPPLSLPYLADVFLVLGTQNWVQD